MRLFRKLGKYFLFGFKTIFSSKIVHLVILLLTFFITSYNTYRSITLQNKINAIAMLAAGDVTEDSVKFAKQLIYGG